MILGLAVHGVTPLIFGDLKPDYAQLVAALGGQVLRGGPGLDRINFPRCRPLAPGPRPGRRDRLRCRFAPALSTAG